LEKARAAGADMTDADNKWDALIPKLMNAARTPPEIPILIQSIHSTT
jgi:hypothetical protein